MTPRTGKAGSLVAPVAPKEALEADQADPGEVAAMKAEQAETRSGKYGSAPVKPYKQQEASPGEQEEGEAEELHWIEIELVGPDGKAAPGEPYEVTLPDGSVASGTLDHTGRARVEGFAPGGTCKVSFPGLDEETWEAA